MRRGQLSSNPDMLLTIVQQVGLLMLLTAADRSIGQQDCRFSWYIPPNGLTYTLRSPNYPSPFRPGSVCYWYLYTDEGSNINLNCDSVSLNGVAGWGCRDTLTVYGSNADDSYCAPFSVQSEERKILFSLQSSGLTPGSGGTFSCSVRSVTAARTCDCGWSFRTKIVGGQMAGVNEFPSMAALVDAGRRAQICGATIISDRWVVTAAHCLAVLAVSTTGVLVGDHDLSTGAETPASRLYRSSRFVQHPNYVSRTARNDIALIQTTERIEFSARVGPVCLPFGRPDTPALGEMVTILGWGTTSSGGMKSDQLLKATVRVVPMARCQAAFNGSSPTADRQICTFQPGRDSCQLDSGGPVLSADPRLSRFFLAGLISYGGLCAGDDPSVSTKIVAYIPWILNVVGGQDNFCVK